MDLDWTQPKSAATAIGTMEYHDFGPSDDRPVVVMLQLILGRADHWDLVVPHLAAGHRCIVPELPMGSHRVPVDDDKKLTIPLMAQAIANLLDHLDVNDVIMVGNDTGGAMTQIVAANHGERVKTLVLVDCDMYDQWPPVMFNYFKILPFVPGGMWQLGQTLRLKFIWKLPIAFGWLAHNIRKDTIARWGAGIRANKKTRRDLRNLIRSLDTKYLNDAAEVLKTAGKRVVLVWGADDRLFHLKNAERMAAEVPDSKLIVLDDCKALPPWDQPVRLAEIISHEA